MTKKTLSSNFFFFLVLIILVNLSLGLYSSVTLRRTLYEQAKSDLDQTARLLAALFDKLYSSDPQKADSFCKALDQESLTRVTIILPSGKVIGDSQSEISLMNNHFDRPEVQRALKGEPAFEIRSSATLNKEMLYLALPISTAEGTPLVLRTSLSLTQVEESIRKQYLLYFTVSLISLLFTALWSGFIILKIIRPLKRMTLQAKAYAEGNLSALLPETGEEAREFSELSGTLNTMAGELKRRMEDITRQKDQLSAILSSMADSVILLDSHRIIRELNPSASGLLKMGIGDTLQHSLIEVFRNTELDRLAGKAFEGKEPVEGEITLAGNPGIHLQVHGVQIGGEQVVLVLHDISRIKRLEEIRKDFVANVSHELKTPITSIKGFVETLLDGALEEPVTAKRFLVIIEKQAEQINAIIDDLLTLSRMEQGEPKKPELLPRDTAELIASALQVTENKADRKGIKISCSCEENLRVPANPVLLEQALVNLLDNAIKYSPGGSRIILEAVKEGKKAKLTVKDRGCGIPEQDLPRIFERFYRVDKARSRELGGTGLGLAIVKHIILYHDGEIFVESTLGEGTTFTVYLPILEEGEQKPENLQG